MVLLSASMIVRNEAAHLEACLLSFRDLVDEIVIVDTGSTDCTREIGLGFGARVYDFKWCDDFSAARNEALRRSRGTWILSIDADERVRPTSRLRLHQILRAPSAIAFYVQLYSRKDYTPFWEMRLFRNDPRLRFEGIIHENIRPNVARYRARHGGEIGRSELTLDHVGDDGTPDRKHPLYLPLLQRAVARDPGNVYCWSHLGTIHSSLSDPERARKAWQSGIAAVRRKKARGWGDSLPYVKLIHLELKAKRGVDALLEEALALFPDHPHLLWLRGLTRIRHGHYADAISDFARLARWRAEVHQSDGRLGFNEQLFGALPYRALAECYRHLGRHAESQGCAAMADRCEQEATITTSGPTLAPSRQSIRPTQ